MFSLKPKWHSFKAKNLKLQALSTLQVNGSEQLLLQMKVTQLPILINNASTGHKLHQGSGVDNLFIHNWSYIKNWPYVMLSHVKTHAGLFCRRELSKDLQKYTMPEALLKRMLQHFCSKCDFRACTQCW